MSQRGGDMLVGGSRRRAVTLLELVLVIGLLLLVAMFVWPDFESATRSERLDESARRMKSLIAMCRAEAMNDSRRYRIVIRLDGSLKVRRQVDPIVAPHIYGRVRRDWARTAFLQEDVWVESVTLLPDGPPPVQVEDELVEFEDMEEDFELIPIAEFEEPVVIEFQLDGTSDSLRWVLRDALGRGLQMTLDGRLGRVATEPIAPLEQDMLERPPEIDADEEEAEQEEAELAYEEARRRLEP